MRAVTRKYSANGAYMESSATLNLGHVVSASPKDPQIIALSVEDAATVSGISLEIVASQNVAVSQGFLKYYSSKDILTSFSNIVPKTASLNGSIPLRNLDSTTSEYVYIWIDPSKITYRGDMFIRFKWNFDYIEPSSSSSSSSSCVYGDIVHVEPYQEVSVTANDCDSVYFQFSLDVLEYATVFFNGEALSIENNGGTLVVCDEFFPFSGATRVIDVNSMNYTVHAIDASSFFVSIASGNCSSSSSCSSSSCSCSSCSCSSSSCSCSSCSCSSSSCSCSSCSCSSCSCSSADSLAGYYCTRYLEWDNYDCENGSGSLIVDNYSKAYVHSSTMYFWNGVCYDDTRYYYPHDPYSHESWIVSGPYLTEGEFSCP